MTLNLAIRELGHVAEVRRGLPRELRSISNGFVALAKATHRSGLPGEEVSHASYERYVLLSADVVHVCR